MIEFEVNANNILVNKLEGEENVPSNGNSIVKVSNEGFERFVNTYENVIFFQGNGIIHGSTFIPLEGDMLDLALNFAKSNMSIHKVAMKKITDVIKSRNRGFKVIYTYSADGTHSDVVKEMERKAGILVGDAINAIATEGCKAYFKKIEKKNAKKD